MEEQLKETCGLRLLYTCSPIELEGRAQVGGFRYRLGRLLGDQVSIQLKDQLDYVVPIPNSGLYYAMGAAESLNVPYLQALVKRDGRQRTLWEPDQQMRERMILDNMMLLPGLLEGKRIALVDEAIFTGTTLRTVCHQLKRQGVANIHILIPTAPCASSCPYECLPQRDLLAQKMTLPEMKEYFGAASLTFLSYTDLCQFTDGFQRVCLNCFQQPQSSGKEEESHGKI